MIKISKLADYGLVILHAMMSDHQSCRSASIIAEQTGIALPTVSKVMKRLNQAGLLFSVRGANGGYHLAKAPDQIDLAMVIAAIDGAPALTKCCQPKYHCSRDERCTLKPRWPLINQAVVTALKQFKLVDLNEQRGS